VTHRTHHFNRRAADALRRFDDRSEPAHDVTGTQYDYTMCGRRHQEFGLPVIHREAVSHFLPAVATRPIPLICLECLVVLVSQVTKNERDEDAPRWKTDDGDQRRHARRQPERANDPLPR